MIEGAGVLACLGSPGFADRLLSSPPNRVVGAASFYSTSVVLDHLYNLTPAKTSLALRYARNLTLSLLVD
jgi:hypothetical protein